MSARFNRPPINAQVRPSGFARDLGGPGNWNIRGPRYDRTVMNSVGTGDPNVDPLSPDTTIVGPPGLDPNTDNGWQYLAFQDAAPGDLIVKAFADMYGLRNMWDTSGEKGWQAHLNRLNSDPEKPESYWRQNYNLPGSDPYEFLDWWTERAIGKGRDKFVGWEDQLRQYLYENPNLYG